MSDVKMGHLVVFEGNERVGKTTQRELVKAALEAKGYEVVVTREPGGTPFGEVIRDLIQHSDRGRDLDPATELMLIGAQRQEHNRLVIDPALLAGKVVLCDRNFFSTFAYQVHPHQRDDLMHLFSTITNVNQMAVNNTQPIMVNLKLDEAVRQARLEAEPAGDNFEDRPVEYLANVTAAYDMLEHQPGALTYDAARPEAELTDAIVTDLLACFEQQRQAAQQTPEAAPEAEATADSEDDTPQAAEAITVDQLIDKVKEEIDVHAGRLEELYQREFNPAMKAEWDEHKETLRKWADLHRDELKQTKADMPAEEADKRFQQLSANIGSILGSWLTLKNIQEMTTQIQTKQN